VQLNSAPAAATPAANTELRFKIRFTDSSRGKGQLDAPAGGFFKRNSGV
jgi:hypothetical protein